MTKLIKALLVVVLVLAPSISRVRTPEPLPAAAYIAPKPKPRVLDKGIASTYGDGDGFAGKQTANGETFDPTEMTAAHKYLPFGTRVRVVNRRNGRSVIVRINDRGPFVRGRVIDLSTAAAAALHLRGIAPVLIQEVLHAHHR